MSNKILNLNHNFNKIKLNKNFQKNNKKNFITIIDQNTTAYREFLGHNRKKT